MSWSSKLSHTMYMYSSNFPQQLAIFKFKGRKIQIAKRKKKVDRSTDKEQKRAEKSTLRQRRLFAEESMHTIKQKARRNVLSIRALSKYLSQLLPPCSWYSFLCPIAPAYRPIVTETRLRSYTPCPRHVSAQVAGTSRFWSGNKCRARLPPPG